MNPPQKSGIVLETWYGEHGEALQITGIHEDCLAELVIPRPSNPQECERVVEVLIRPRDNLGFPCGPPVVVQRIRVRLLPQFGQEHFAAEFWLAEGVSPQIVRECFFRVTDSAASMSAGDSENSD